MSAPDPNTLRAEMLEGWDTAAAGWGRRADRIRKNGMPVSLWMIEHLSLQPGQRVLELAAGPGDTGFLAAELVAPGGTLISSDGSEAMLAVARERAASLGIRNVEFKRLELEWIDLPTASVDAVLCRWGLMLSLDPAAAAHEARRVLRPGGSISVAVWDDPQANPWATISARALIDAGLIEPPEPGGPGMFALAGRHKLRDLLESAGFVDVVVEGVEVERFYASTEEYLAETHDLSQMFPPAMARARDTGQESAVRAAIADSLAPFMDQSGTVVLPGRSLVASASA